MTSRRPRPAQKTPAARFLDLLRKSTASIRADVPKLTAMGERMAHLLLKGGELFAPYVAEWWTSEYTHRAGGFMGLQSSKRPTSKDVLFLALPDPRHRKDHQIEALKECADGPAHLFAIGRPDELEGTGVKADRFEGFTGGAPAATGLYGCELTRPLAIVRPFEQIVRGWVVSGELTAAATRAGKMPTVWMSVWLEGAFVRNNAFYEHNNLREPWHVPTFHRDVYIPPLAPGYAAGSFLELVDRQWEALHGQRDRLAQAGEWLAEAKRKGRTAWVVAVGHSYPRILQVLEERDYHSHSHHGRHEHSRPTLAKGYPLDWGYSYSDLSKAVPRKLGRGDAVLHMGYAPVDVRAVQGVLQRGIRLIHTSPYGRPQALKDHRNLIWLDLPWRPGDATIDVPGYSVRICPGSSSAHSQCYFPVLCEVAERLRLV